ncbi:zinc ABC transporter substrate-binding protein [Virgibacillus halodenitrificans]|uniref:metal ABC transporter substrate-binding protein n=1 Tax=Virgibacillus halodenitrificans TaxID=1482 RepID=UPI00045C4D4A|nr:zinc ABC transporter substrate-binding protein [Virgibacillus halodenitrificans]MCG1026937.1 zinc ABC transporter substrate-binding protein [Virgibacillus halodenitrificans]CDQ30742.1 putative zinc transport system zinc-binding lipoprotein AdcA precursor [Virgibacillus halodenitrificans]
MKQFFLAINIILLSIGTVACSQQKENADDQLTIYASIYPIQFAIEQIGGDRVNTNTIYPPGVDAHTYEPTSKTMTSLAESNAFIFLGAGMEAFAEKAADALAKQEVELVELGNHEELFHTEQRQEHTHDDGHHHGDHNPHIWLDPQRMIKMTELIKDELIKLQPSSEKYFTENFNTLKQELMELDKLYTEKLENKQDKQIMVSHAAYSYWEDRYGIKQIAINGLSSNDEPSQKELTQIIDQAKKFDINYIVFEQNSSNRVTEIIQKQLGAEAVTIHNLAVLTDTDIKNDENYLTIMKQNLKVLNQITK